MKGGEKWTRRVIVSTMIAVLIDLTVLFIH